MADPLVEAGGYAHIIAAALFFVLAWTAFKKMQSTGKSRYLIFAAGVALYALVFLASGLTLLLNIRFDYFYVLFSALRTIGIIIIAFSIFRE